MAFSLFFFDRYRKREGESRIAPGYCVSCEIVISSLKKAVLKGPRCYSRETQLIIMPRVPRGAGCSAIDRVTRSVTHTQQQQKHISLSHFQVSFFLFHSPPFITAQFRSGIVDWEEVEATKEKKKKEMLVHCSISNPTKSKQRRLEFNKRKKKDSK